jgi:tripartite-type tricarboxylate transporter receptor subunit TctC
MKIVGFVVAAASVAAIALPAQGQGLPEKIQILVGVAAGGPNDSIARMVADRLRAKKGITAIVENRTGANGLIAATALIKSPPNGQTILIMSQGLATISPHLSKMPFDPLKDLTPIAGLATTDVGFCVANKIPAENLKDFVTYARNASKPVTFGAAGIGNVTHLLLERLKDVAKIPYTLVVYKGIAPSLQDVAGGHIDGSVCALVTARPLVQAGKLKLIGLFGDKRSKVFPNVPTTAEQGYPITDPSWYGVFGPPNMPAETVTALFNAIREVATDPDTVAGMEKVGFDPWIQEPARLSMIMREESARWGKLVRDNNIKVE